MSSRKKVLIGVLHSMESTLKLTEVLKCKNKNTFFINKFQGVGFRYPLISDSNFFSQLVGCLFILLRLSSVEQKFC